MNKKIVLWALAAVAFVCVLACGAGVFFAQRFASNAVVTEPAQVRAMAREIADYTLPPRYADGMGMNMVVFKMVMHMREPGDVILLMSMPAMQDEEQMQRSFSQGITNGSNRRITWESTKRVNITVSGKTVPASEMIGTLENGARVRGLSFGYSGRSGAVGVMVMAQEAGWNQSEVNAFVASLR